MLTKVTQESCLAVWFLHIGEQAAGPISAHLVAVDGWSARVPHRRQQHVLGCKRHWRALQSEHSCLQPCRSSPLACGSCFLNLTKGRKCKVAMDSIIRICLS